MQTLILTAIGEALANLDWKFLRPSPYDYKNEIPLPVHGKKWFERLFAYELYHQLRLIWEEYPRLVERCLIQAEVPKEYQNVKMDKMPDFLFHLPVPKYNFAVVEIKLLASGKSAVIKDLDKLLKFKSHDFLKYDCLIEILIGTQGEFKEVFQEAQLANWPKSYPINLFHVCTDLDGVGLGYGVFDYKEIGKNARKFKKIPAAWKEPA